MGSAVVNDMSVMCALLVKTVLCGSIVLYFGYSCAGANVKLFPHHFRHHRDTSIPDVVLPCQVQPGFQSYQLKGCTLSGSIPSARCIGMRTSRSHLSFGHGEEGGHHEIRTGWFCKPQTWENMTITLACHEGINKTISSRKITGCEWRHYRFSSPID